MGALLSGEAALVVGAAGGVVAELDDGHDGQGPVGPAQSAVTFLVAGARRERVIPSCRGQPVPPSRPGPWNAQLPTPWRAYGRRPPIRIHILDQSAIRLNISIARTPRSTSTGPVMRLPPQPHWHDH